VDISANTYAYTAWFNTLSAFIPPWAHEGGNTKLIKRLKETDIRARIRNELSRPATVGTTCGNRYRRLRPYLLRLFRILSLASLQGKRLAEVAAIWNQDPIDAMCELLIKDKAFTRVAIFGMSEPDVCTCPSAALGLGK